MTDQSSPAEPAPRRGHPRPRKRGTEGHRSPRGKKAEVSTEWISLRGEAFRDRLRGLGLDTVSAAPFLGISRATVMRIIAGNYDASPSIRRLLDAMVMTGLRPEDLP